MSLQDDTEKVLRELHILISKADPYPDQDGMVIVNKKEAQKLLGELNQCLYDVMEDYEQSKESKARAERAAKKEGEAVLKEYQRRAEDVYAASIIYSNDALEHVWDMMSQTVKAMDDFYGDISKRMKDEQRAVKKNQSELRSHLHDLEDTQKYVKILEEERRQEEAEKRAERIMPKKSRPDYKARRSAIQVNSNVLNKLGLTEAAAAANEDARMTAEDYAAKHIMPQIVSAKVSESAAAAPQNASDAKPAENKKTVSTSPLQSASSEKPTEQLNTVSEGHPADDDFISIDIDEEMVKMQEMQKKFTK